MRARVPASSANLGPGFDTLGLALSRWTEVSVEPADSLTMLVNGQGSEFATDHNHFAVKIVKEVLGHTNVRIEIFSEIPVSRGLGSSASLAIACAAAAGHPDPLTYVALLEGHADNAAASVLGGFVTATIANGVVYASRLPLDPELRFVVIIPDRHLATKQARSALPVAVPMKDAVANLGLLGHVIAAMSDHRMFRDFIANTERLHQPYRTKLYPESVAMMQALLDGGAMASFWSGAGPTLLGVCHRDVCDAVASSARIALTASGLPGAVDVLDVATQGLVLSEG
jgi:homoserine kinase